jgi:hypothetical protein
MLVVGVVILWILLVLVFIDWGVPVVDIPPWVLTILRWLGSCDVDTEGGSRGSKGRLGHM